MSNVASLPPEQPTDESKLNGASDQPNPSKPSSSPVLARHSASPSGMQLDDQPTAGTGQQVVQADPLEHNKRVVHVPIDTTSSSLTSAMIFARYPELAGSEPFPESSKDPRVDRTSGRVVKVWQEQPDWGAITHPFGPKPAAAAAAPVAEKVPEPAPRSEEAPPAKLSDAAVDAADDDDTADDTADDAPAADGHPEGAEAAGAEEAGEAAAREDIRKPEVAVEAPSKHEQADLAPTDELAPTDDDVSQAEEENEEDEEVCEMGQSESEGEEVETEAQRLLSPVKGILSPLKVAALVEPRCSSPRAMASPRIGPCSPRLSASAFTPSPPLALGQDSPSPSLGQQLLSDTAAAAQSDQSAPTMTDQYVPAPTDQQLLEEELNNQKDEKDPKKLLQRAGGLKPANPRKLKGELTGSYWDAPAGGRGRRGTRKGASPTEAAGRRQQEWKEQINPSEAVRPAKRVRAEVEQVGSSTAVEEKRPRMTLESLTDNVLVRALKFVCSEQPSSGAPRQAGDAVDDSRAKELSEGYENMDVWKGRWGRAELQHMVNSLTDAYVAALTVAAKEEPTPYVEVSDEVIDALGAAPPKPKQQNTSVAYAGTERTKVEQQQRSVALTLAFAASKKLTCEQIKSFQQSELRADVPIAGGRPSRGTKRPLRAHPSVPHVRIMQCSQLGWVVKELPANAPVSLQVPSWAQDHKIGAERRSAAHLQAVRMAVMEGHFPADPKANCSPSGSPACGPREELTAEEAAKQQLQAKQSEYLTELVKNAPKKASQNHDLQRKFFNSGTGSKIFRSVHQATDQESPEIAKCRERLKILARQCSSKDIPVAVRPVIALLNELLTTTENRIGTAWASAELLCQKYTEEQNVSISARRESFNQGLHQLGEVVAQSTPNLHDRNLAMESIELEDVVADGKPSAQRVDRILRKWCFEHFSQPYPDKQEKEQLAVETKLTTKKLNDWLTNWRKRVLNSR